MHLNKSPILAPAKTLTAKDAQRIGIDRETCLENLAKFRNHPEIREKLIGVYSIEREFKKSSDVDAMLYDGFFNPADKTAMKIIRETDPECLSTLDISFDDERISKLLFRYRARNFPWTLNESEQQKWANHCREYFEQRIEDYMLNLENLVHEHEQCPKQMDILKSIYQHVETLVS